MCPLFLWYNLQTDKKDGIDIPEESDKTMNENEILSQLNDRQQEAVLQTEGPLLILAGAGSGKTRVLVHRIAWLMDVNGVRPWNILAITFTNKAAEEMRRRVEAITDLESGSVWVSTFHSLCVRILRRHADLLGYSRSFTIYDTDDQMTLMKRVFKEHPGDLRSMKERAVLSAISKAKDELTDVSAFRLENKDFYGEKTAALYEAYQRNLKESNAMDFDDLIVNTVRLFEQHPEVLDLWQERFHYIMVDEYQDTNTAQFRLLSLLAAKSGNLCVVGDDDQSIYKFRGANIRNILSFEKIFREASVVRLEQNYRSTGMILKAANEVIRHNRGRKEKTLWTERGDGEKVRFRRFDNAFEEAEFVCGEIASDVRSGNSRYGDHAILYRTNAQSRLFEEKFLLANIPYKIVGGVNFYSRKEIKDLLAYLRMIANDADDLSVRRIINVPKRGIGAATVARLDAYAQAGGISLCDALAEIERIPGISGAAASKLTGFAGLIAVLREKAGYLPVYELLRETADLTGYTKELELENTDESKARLENIEELMNKASQYDAGEETPTLTGFLEEISLIADIDTLEDSDDRVLLFTLHAAKGLEFPDVYMTGMEEGLFPGSLSIHADNPQEEIEEERRLAYVGITRAMNRLTLTCARSRMVRGDIMPMPISRFVREIPKELLDLGSTGEAPARRKPGGGLDERLRSALMTDAGRLTFGKDFHEDTESAYSGRSTYRNPYLKGQGAAGRTPGSAPPAARTSSGGSGFGYETGDLVRHIKFGQGTVREMKYTDRGCMVTVDFQSWGVKKMRAEVANLVKCN